jgi:hypothetical protein
MNITQASDIISLINQEREENFIIEVLINNKIIPNNECYYTALTKSIYQYSKIRYQKLIKIFFEAGLVPIENHLIIACSYKFIDLVNFLLDCGIQPTEQVFHAAINHKKTYYVKDDRIYYQYGYNAKFKEDMGKSEIVNLLCDYGYNLTYNNLLEATEQRVLIKNIEKYNFNFDNEFMKIANKTNFYPNYKTTNLYNIEILEEECKKTGNLTVIKKIIKSGVKPNIKCLEFACQNHSNTNSHTINYLINDCGIMPNKQCLENAILYSTNKPLTIIYQNLIKNNIITFNDIKEESHCDTSKTPNKLGVLSEIKEEVKKESKKKNIKIIKKKTQ